MTPSLRRPVAISALICVLLPLILAACDSRSPVTRSRPLPETFTIFEVGPNSVLTEDQWPALRNKLGRESVSRRNVIKLDLYEPGFVDSRFPELKALNRRLNGTAGMRIEHHTINLTFRYTNKTETPFDTVTFLLSEYTHTPLMIHIADKDDHRLIRDTLESRYGPPRTVPGANPDHHLFYWQRSGDYLILSAAPNPAGRPTYEILICFTARITELLEMEGRAEPEEGSREKKAIQDLFS